jgi:hypothetical protein
MRASSSATTYTDEVNELMVGHAAPGGIQNGDDLDSSDRGPLTGRRRRSRAEYRHAARFQRRGTTPKRPPLSSMNTSVGARRPSRPAGGRPANTEEAC